MRPILITALILPFVCHAGQKTQTPTRPTPKGTVEGVVLNGATGESLRKAWVTLSRAHGPGGDQSVLSEVSGKFSFKDIEPGQYSLRVERNGFATQMYGQRSPQAPWTILSISAGQSIRDIEVRLTPAAAISGHIYDEDGEPVASARVSALRYDYHNGQRKLVPMASASTNDLGEYRIFGLAPGRYFLSAVHEHWDRPPVASTAVAPAENEKTAEMAYAPTYFPGVNDLARAAALEIRSGDDLPGYDLTLLTTRAVRVRGRILNAGTGKGARFANIVLMPRESSVRFAMPSAQTFVNDPEGDFEVRGVVPGAFMLVAHVWDGENRMQAKVPLDVGAADIDGVLVSVSPGIDIVGRLQWEGPAPAKDVSPQIHLQAKDELIFFGGVSAEVKLEGLFALKNVVDGDYGLHVFESSEECFVKSARLGGEDVLQDGMSITGGKAAGALEVVMSCASGTVEGQVLNDQQKPVTEARVVLIPEGERRNQQHLFASASPDQYGHFVMKGVTPGNYKVFAWENVEYDAYKDPEFLRRYEDSGKPVAVGEGSRLTVQLQVIPAEKTQP